MPLTVTHRTSTIVGAPRGPMDTVYAKWTGRSAAKSSNHYHPEFLDTYDVIIRPHTPLEVGRSVKLLALSLEAYHVPAYPPPIPPRYDIYDPQIEGKIVRARSIGHGNIEFVLENKVRGNAVGIVHLAVKYVPNVTAKLDLVDKASRWLSRNPPIARTIPLEEAVIVDTVTTIQYSRDHASKGLATTRRTEVQDTRGREREKPERVTAEESRDEEEIRWLGACDRVEAEEYRDSKEAETWNREGTEDDDDASTIVGDPGNAEF